MIYLSAGHNKDHPGACYNGFCEHDQAREWVLDIYSYMGSSNSRMVTQGTLKDKVAFINKRKPLSAVEIHFNSYPGLDAKGCEVLYFPGSEKGVRLALEVVTSLGKIMTPNRGVKEGYFQGDSTKGVDYFLEKTKCPSIIIEAEFIFNKDVILKKRDEACKQIARTLTEALEWLEKR